MSNQILKNALIMSLFAIIAISTTIVINKITEEKISLQNEKEHNLLLDHILSSKKVCKLERKLYKIQNQALGNNKTHKLWLLLNQNHNAIGAIVETTAPDGYSGDINMLLAAYFTGKIIGVRVISHKETPGIGDKIDLSVSDWITKFSNLYVNTYNDKSCVLKKYGGKIEQFTGATITPQSVTNAVRRTVVLIKNIPFMLNHLNKNFYEDQQFFTK